LPIEWDAIIIENIILAAIIYGAIYIELRVEKERTRKEERKNRKQIIQFVTNDLNKKLRFIDESIQYHDFKPFFTDMWDSIILGGKQTLLPFALFENLQHTYSWMKYYNNEIEQREKDDEEKTVLEVLEEVRKSINQSLLLLKESNP
jgi:hypothetical protein